MPGFRFPGFGVNEDTVAVTAALPASAGTFQTPELVFVVKSLPKNLSGKRLERALRERFSSHTVSQ
jgi:acyl-coenzyme A synthetase/AMP-(fatty) acid ligase